VNVALALKVLIIELVAVIKKLNVPALLLVERSISSCMLTESNIIEDERAFPFERVTL
jgi:hypothetical protein